MPNDTGEVTGIVKNLSDATSPRSQNIEGGANNPPPLDPEDFNWRNNLLVTGEGKVRTGAAANWQKILRCHEDTRGAYAWNDVTQGVFVMRPLP